MKLHWASGFLLGLIVRSVDANAESHIPFATDSSHIEPETEGPIDPEAYLWQARPHGGKLLPRNQFTTHCSSMTEGSRCEYANDGLAETHWVSGYHSVHETDELVLDLHKVRNVNGISMRPLMGEEDRGQIAKHEVYVSVDRAAWTKVAYGTWGWNKSPKMSAFEAIQARYVKLRATSEAPPPRHPSHQYPDAVTKIVDVNVYTTNAVLPHEPSKGLWGPTLDLPITAAAGAHGFGAKGHHNIMLWSAWTDDRFFASPGGKTFTATWDPYLQDIVQTNVTNTYHDIFCPGISMDIDGNIVVSGGADSQKTSIYDGSDWIPGGDMNLHRGYHSSTTLSDGKIFAIGGSWSGGSNMPKDGEVYDPATKRWRILPNIKADVIHTVDIPLRNDNHAWLFGWKNGSVFHAGPSKRMFWFDTHGDGNVKRATLRLNDQDSTSGNAVMFDAVRGKIVAFGGQEYYDGSFGHRNAHRITIKEPFKRPLVDEAGLNGTDGIKGAGGMYNQRVYHTSVVLPDGTVFITGGEIYGVPFNEDERDVQLTPEIYHPEWDVFLPLKQNNIVRVYHSLSILLPDATVLNGGSGLCGNCTANHYDAQIFTPPYLLREDGTPAERPSKPEIVNNQYRVQVGAKLAFQTDADIRNASLIRLGTVSHTVNTDQRRIPLSFTRSTEPVNGRAVFHAAIPHDPGIALPGYYMLFVMNDRGVPSHAATVKVELPRTSHTSPETEQLLTVEEEKEEEDLADVEKPEADYDMEMDEKEAQGIMNALFAATRKFWSSRLSGLVYQG
ncbi:galactose oxidase precursor [Penicillium hispanicum]|uniref:galactose oxidase precursor n=1 Tax=Penicillium hispanicum TaxID=1080232 RepID=UPI002541047A|nr:galactose oxidase precursor [Penicillium hispanicum]KAJ5573495.1 galactose oxidase precursor [Penicillium hispanicum]